MPTKIKIEPAAITNPNKNLFIFPFFRRLRKSKNKTTKKHANPASPALFPMRTSDNAVKNIQQYLFLILLLHKRKHNDTNNVAVK